MNTISNTTEVRTPASETNTTWVISASDATTLSQEQGMSDLYIFATKYAEIHGYISVAVCLFGIMANIANIVVLTRRHMVTSTNYILTWLAIADLLTMLSYFPFAIHFYILKDPTLDTWQTRGLGWICFLLFHASFSVVCHTLATWLTIALAIFRFLYIWFPTRGCTFCSLKNAKITIAIVMSLTVIICIPNFIINNMKEIKNTTLTENGTFTTEIIYSFAYREGENYAVLSDINYWIQALLFKLIPCLMLTLLTILLITAMHRAYKKRMALKQRDKKEGKKRHDSDKNNEHNRTTLMLLAVVVLFLITELPQGILTILNSIIDKFNIEVYQPLGDLLDIMALCNNAINFVLYCSMSKQFRDTFFETFCGCCPEKRPGWMRVKLVTITRNGKTANMNNMPANNAAVTHC